MKLKEWIKKTSTYELRQLAKKVKVHPQYIYQVADHRPSASLAKKIEKAVGELTPNWLVTKEELRPDIWKN